jgi:hypothetical protein
MNHIIEGQTQLQDTLDRQTVVRSLLLNQHCVINRQQSDSTRVNFCRAAESVLDDSTSMHEILQHSAREIRSDWHPSISRSSSFTIDPVSLSTSEMSGGIRTRRAVVDTDRSVTDSTITVIHEDEPRYIAARAKYDTGSDFNFTSSAFVTKHGLSTLLEILDNAEVFVGLNSQEYHVKHTIVLHWCASTMHKTRTTTFFVADEVPYDILLGNEFIIQNGIFEGRRAVLALRHKHRSAGT